MVHAEQVQSGAGAKGLAKVGSTGLSDILGTINIR